MIVRATLAICAATLLSLTWQSNANAEAASNRGEPVTESADALSLFDAVEQGVVEMKFVAKSDRRARVILTNISDEPVILAPPEAFAGVPVLGQGFGGGGGGGGLGGGGGGGGQSVGGGGGGGQFGGGGGGGQFSIPPEKTTRVDLAVLCLDHGKRDPSSSKPYEMVAATDHVERPAVVELLKAFGRGELNHGAAQAAVWALNNDIPWAELAAKQRGSVRDVNRSPYFTRAEIEVGMAYAREALRRAELAQDEYDELYSESSLSGEEGEAEMDDAEIGIEDEAADDKAADDHEDEDEDESEEAEAASSEDEASAGEASEE